MTTEINEALARRCLEVVDAGLVSGVGVPEPGKMCVEAAINFAMGQPHGDEPDCVAPALRAFKIRINDSNWSSDQARAKGLRRLAIAQLGSAGALDEKEFARRCAVLAIQVAVPAALRAAAGMKANGAFKDRLLKAAEDCEREPTRENAIKGKDAAYAAYTYADAYAAAASYAYAAAAADHAAYAADHAAYAADADAYAYAASYAYAAADAYVADADADAARDKSLADFCERVVEILIDMKAPGCQWLWLTEVA